MKVLNAGAYVTLRHCYPGDATRARDALHSAARRGDTLAAERLNELIAVERWWLIPSNGRPALAALRRAAGRAPVPLEELST